jgi:bifunctional UDP-N-acetylglucosamine pyrophosphorylase/glucosamine-1-phosphate N-acetyltransferase
MDPDRIEIRGKLHAEKDVRIDIGCVFEGEVYLRSGAQIGPYCVIKDSDIGERSQIKAFTHIEQAKIGPHNQIGPYARVRPGTMTAEEVHIGNFVEIKNSEIGKESKANHLAYVGDTQVGKEVNIGAGVITCNYDGANKHQTMIGDGAFIGSNSQLVAPVTIGSGATIGAGSTIVADAPSNQLTLSRAPQRTVASWTRPIKKT